VFGKRGSAGAGNPAPGAKEARPQAGSPAPAPVKERPDAAASRPLVVEAGRSPIPSTGLGAPLVSAPPPSVRTADAPSASSPPLVPSSVDSRHTEAYYETKSMVFGALIEAIDLAQLAKLDIDSAREEIRDIVNEIIAIKAIVLSISEQEELLDDICNDVLGYGPLEPLLARDDITDIMVNSAGTTYIEVKGKIQKTGIRFRDNQQLLNICQRIVSQIGRRVDESSPICDARLPDGSRVNVIVPPLALDGPSLTIRKFKKDKLTLEQLVRFGASHRKAPRSSRSSAAAGSIPSSPAAPARARRRCSTASRATSMIASASSPARMPPSCSFSSRTRCAWRRVRPISKAKARSPCATWCATVCACGRKESSSARSAGPKHSICCRP